MTNKIGKRGESLFTAMISKHVENKGHLLNPEFLGDKFPTVDFLVDLYGYQSVKGFCFVSVKTTRDGGYTNQGNLKISIGKLELEELRKIPVPTYIAGIDEKEEKGFLIAVQGISTEALLSLPTTFPIDERNIFRLWDEVKNYWEQWVGAAKFVSIFKIEKHEK